MNFSVKHQILSKSIIVKAAFNQKKNVLCCILDGVQNVAFYQLDPHGQFQQIKTQNARPLAINNILSWSPNGDMLALGQTKVEVWSFNNSQLAFYKLFNQQFTQIRTIVWAADSTRYACAGLHKEFSIIVRNVNTSQLKSVKLDSIVASISFDPFGKYLFALTLDNHAIILRNSLQIVKSVNLSSSPNKSTPVKESRITSWSADYSCIFTPSLQDSKIPIAVSLSRSKDFKVNQIIVGHPSSINCITFNPKLFEFDGQTLQIVAIGDTSGFISIWKIGKQKKHSQQPLLLARCHQNSDEVIQYLQWDSTGTYLFVHSHKKYLIVYKFDKKNLGRELNVLEFNSYLEKLYGASSADQMRALDLPVFSAGQYKPTSTNSQKLVPELVSRIQSNNPTNTFRNTNLASMTTKPIILKTKQQNFIENGKKKIIPSKFEEIKPQNQILQSGIEVPVMVNPIKLLRLSQKHKIKSIYKITQKSFLEIKNLSTNRQHITIIRLVEVVGYSSMVDQDIQKIIHNQRAFQGDIDFLQITNQYVFLVNMSNLYTFDKNLNVAQLPLCVGNLYELVINNNLDAYGISVDGTVRGYNLRTRKMFCDTNIAVLIQNKQSEQNNSDPIEESQIGMDHQLYIRMSKNKLQYFLDLSNSLWNRLDFDSGNLTKGHSIRISKRQLNKNREIFAYNPAQINKNAQISLTQLQYNLIFYKKCSPNLPMYYQSVYNFIRELLNRNLQIQLRDSLLKYIFNSNNPDYIRDIEAREKLWQKLKVLGGKVIEEFVLLNSVN